MTFTESTSWTMEYYTPTKKLVENTELASSNTEKIEPISKRSQELENIITSIEEDKNPANLLHTLNSFYDHWLWGKAADLFFWSMNNNVLHRYSYSISVQPVEKYNPETYKEEINYRQKRIKDDTLNKTQKYIVLHIISDRKKQAYAIENLWCKNEDDLSRLTDDTLSLSAFEKGVLFNEIGKAWPWCIVNLNPEYSSLWGKITDFLDENVWNGWYHPAMVSRIEEWEIYIIESDKEWKMYEAKLSDCLERNNSYYASATVMKMNVNPEQNKNILTEVHKNIANPNNNSDKSIIDTEDKKYCSEIIVNAIREVTGKSLEWIKTLPELNKYTNMFVTQYQGQLWGIVSDEKNSSLEGLSASLQNLSSSI